MRFVDYIIRVLELILLISISVFVIHALCISGDRETLIHNLNKYAVGLFWLLPISISLLVCVFVSLINSFHLKSGYNRIVLGIYLFNIFSMPITLLVLPPTSEPTAHAMAENLRAHTKEMRRMVDLVDNYMGDDVVGFVYENINGNILELSIRIGGKWMHLKEISELWQNGKSVGGISLQKLQVLDGYMRAANVQGIDFCKEEPSFSILFRRWGDIDFEYKIYRNKNAAKKERDTYKLDKSAVWFNDTIAFVRYGIYPGGGEFVDYEQFLLSKGMKGI